MSRIDSFVWRGRVRWGVSTAPPLRGCRVPASLKLNRLLAEQAEETDQSAVNAEVCK